MSAPPRPRSTGRKRGGRTTAPQADVVAAGDALSAVPSTLRIPLAARAFGDALFPHVAVGDAYAAPLLEALGDDGSRWKNDWHGMFSLLARAWQLRDLARRFLKRHPDGHVVNIGCGLSHYFQWLDNGRSRMTDADLPEVVAIRRRLLPATNPRHILREVDLTSADWWDALDLPASTADRPVFIMIEGVLMYLQPEQVQRVFRTFGERAPAGSTLSFDASCWMAVGRANWHPSVRLTEAQFSWGLRSPNELTAASDRLRLHGTYPVMERLGLPFTLLGPMFRGVFGVPAYAVYALRTEGGTARAR